LKKLDSKVYFIGAGPGDPELITLKGMRIIESADLVLYAGSLVPESITESARDKAIVQDSSSMNLEQTHELMRDTVHNGGAVARVHTGDPSLYGAIREQIILLEQEGLGYEVIPGVTAGFAAAAKAGVSFTLPEKTQSLIFTRISGRTSVPEKERLSYLAEHNCSLVLYLSASLVENAVSELKQGGYTSDTPVIIASRIGWSGEEVINTRLDRMAEVTTQHEIGKQAVFLILPDQEGETTFSKLYDRDFSHGFRNGRDE